MILNKNYPQDSRMDLSSKHSILTPWQIHKVYGHQEVYVVSNSYVIPPHKQVYPRHNKNTSLSIFQHRTLSYLRL